MNRGGLWRVSILTRPAAEEAVAELLEREFGTGAVSDYDVETTLTTLSVYLEREPRRWVATRRNLSAELARIKACGLDCRPGQIRWERVRREDWANSWKRHFKPLVIGASLLIKPSWSRRRPRRGQAVVLLDPGLSFGTGQHPTTAFCLEQLAGRRRPGERQPFLDMGTGSGILGIAAAKLGYSPVHGFDSDPEAVRIARGNARRNRVDGKVRFYQDDITQPARLCRQRFALVCANLLSTLLVKECGRILERVRPDGVLVLAGILKGQFREVERVYKQRGWRLAASRTVREWRSGSFVRDS